MQNGSEGEGQTGPRDPWRFQRWAFAQQTGSVARKAVLSNLAMMADSETGRCQAKQSTIAHAVELSERAVRTHLKALEDANLICRRQQHRRDGSRRGDEYLLLAPGVEEWPDGEPVGSHPADPAGCPPGSSASSHPEAEGQATRKQGSAQERPLRNGHVGTTASSSTLNRNLLDIPDEVPDDIAADALALLKAKTKVATRVVSDAEMMIAAAAMAQINAELGTDFGLGAHLTPIVGRIRERPSWDAAKHQRLVQSACRLRWWERNGNRRRPTPAVIYGNPRVFEQVAQDAAEEAAGTLRDVPVSLREAVWPDGRRWDELTPEEQTHAREAVTRGKRPWEARETPAGPAADGPVLPPITADTWLDS